MGARYNIKESVFLDFKSPMTCWEYTKLVLLMPLLPIRVCLLLILLSIIAAINTIACISWPLDQPLPPWRRAIVVSSQPLAQLILLVLGFRVKFTGWSNVAKGQEAGAVAIFNHSSFVDALLLYSRLTPAGVARQATGSMPFIGRAIRGLQIIYVPESKRRRLDAASALASKPPAPADSGISCSDSTSSSVLQSSASSTKQAPSPAQVPNPTTSKPVNGAGSGTAPANGEAMPAVSKLIIDRVRDPRYCKPGGFPILAMAPEGTVTSGLNLLPFKVGAFLPGHPVLPFLLDYRANTRLNPAWTETNLAIRFVRLLCQWVNHLEVRVLPPYFPSEAEKADPLLYAENVRQLMAKEMNMGLSDDTFANCQKLIKLGIEVGWDGKTLRDPHKVVGADGTVDLDAALEQVQRAKAAAAAAKLQPQAAPVASEAKKVA